MTEDALDLDLERVRRYCAKRIPEHLRDEIRLDVEVRRGAIAIIERRPPWHADFGPEWSSNPIARFRRLGAGGPWTVSWADSRGGWHLDPVRPTKDIASLLAHVDRDPQSHYWG